MIAKIMLFIAACLYVFIASVGVAIAFRLLMGMGES